MRSVSRMIRILFAVLLFLPSCVYFRSAANPMPAVEHPAPAVEADTLVVLLPGMSDGPDDYLGRGFVQLIHEACPTADVVAADAHFGYYRSRTFLDRLQADVIDPRAERYDQIWLVGISLGGFGCAVYCEENPGVIDGLILLAPFMGERAIIEQVKGAGGLAAWEPPGDLGAVEDDAEKKFAEVWAFFRGYAVPEVATELPELFLGWGKDDGLSIPNRMVADVLPEEQVLTLAGGHTWTVWRPLFERLVKRALGD